MLKTMQAVVAAAGSVCLAEPAWIDVDLLVESGRAGVLSVGAPVEVVGEGVRLGLIGEHAEEIDHGITSVRGSTSDGGRFVLATDGVHLFGAAWGESGAFEFRGTGALDDNGRPLVELVPVGALPACSGASEPVADPFGDLAGDPPIAGDGEGTVRVLMLYTPQVYATLGGTDGAMAAHAASAIASTNDAYANSSINPMRVELAASVVVTLPGGVTGGSDALRYLTCAGEGIADEAHTLRDAYQADLVAYIVDLSSFCGVAWLAPDTQTYGFSVSDLDCAVGNLTFAHELGHNQGCAHDPDNASSSYQPYAYGHRWNGDTYRSVMSYSPGTRVPYFSNPSVSHMGGVTGISNARDNARNINETDILLANFRQGTTDPTDCDSSGGPDVVEIANNADLDMNGNGVLDACEIAATPSLDCDANGVLDAYDVSPNVSELYGPYLSIGSGSPVSFGTGALPEAAGDVTMTVVGYGDFSSSSEYIDVSLDAGAFSTTVFISGGDCFAPGLSESVIIPQATFEAMRAGGITFDLTAPTDVNATLCSGIPSFVTVKLDYRAVDSVVDANGNGVVDSCESVACSSADLTTAGAGSGDPGFGVPDGVITSADIQYYVNLYVAGDLGADFTTAGAGSGDPGFGVPDGAITSADIQYYVNLYVAGCP